MSEGDFVQAGDPLTDGTPNPKKLLKIKSPEDVGLFIVNEVQKIYSSQGIDINDKHFEVIVRQMLRNVKIIDPGDSEFIVGEYVDKFKVRRVNEQLEKEGKKPARFVPILLGISQAALHSESWISAASFQETPRVLVFASIEGKIDFLRGIKENVIIGKAIPAGTNFPEFRTTGIEIEQLKPTPELIERELQR